MMTAQRKTPHGSIIESLTRTNTVKPEEVDAVVRRWGRPVRDPYVPFTSHKQYMRLRGGTTNLTTS